MAPAIVYTAIFIFCLVCQVCSQCAPNTTFLDSCYVIPQAEANWIGAVRYCQAIGGNLASLDTADENNFVQSLINSLDKGRRLIFQTPDKYSYRYLEDEGVSIFGHTSIVFQVAACNDVHLALSSTKGESTHDTYEIVIGGWADSMSVIRDCMQCQNRDEDHPLDCKNQRPFWMSWQDGDIRVGMGLTVGENQMMEWQDPTPHEVNHLGIVTGWGSTGSWTFAMNTYSPGVFWLGMTDLQVEGEWNRLPDLEEVEFTEWAPGQPSGGQGRHCAAMDKARGLSWIDADCEVRRNFVCELPAVSL